MTYKRVAVVRGGPSAEYNVSMKTGQAILTALNQLEQPHKDVVITKDGKWLDGGRVRDPISVLAAVDVVLLALHGTYGEDGTIQRLLEQLQLPFTGSSALASALAFNKELTKEMVQQVGVRTPRHRRFSRLELDTLSSDLQNLHDELGHQVFIKPLASGSSVGARPANTTDNLAEIITQLLDVHEQVLVEEYVSGVEATVGVLQDFRDEFLYALPAVEIIPPDSASFYDETVKYNGSTKKIVPGRFTLDVRDELQNLTKLAHTTLGCSQYSRSDFLVTERGIYFLETNTLPGFTSDSLFPKAAAAIGLPFPQLVQHLVETATI